MRSAAIFTFIILCVAGCRYGGNTSTKPSEPDSGANVEDVSPIAAQAEVSKAYSQFVDVRTPEEYAAGHADRAINIPLDTLPANLDRLEKGEPVYLICQTGRRSKIAAGMLKDAGFEKPINIAGGTDAWKSDGLPMELRSPHSLPQPGP